MGNAASGRPAREARRTRRPHLRALNAVVAFAKPGAGDRTALRTIVAMGQTQPACARADWGGGDRLAFAPPIRRTLEPGRAVVGKNRGARLRCGARTTDALHATLPRGGSYPDRKQNAFVRD